MRIVPIGKAVSVGIGMQRIGAGIPLVEVLETVEVAVEPPRVGIDQLRVTVFAEDTFVAAGTRSRERLGQDVAAAREVIAQPQRQRRGVDAGQPSALHFLGIRQAVGIRVHQQV